MWIIENESKVSYTASNVSSSKDLPVGNYLLRYNYDKGFFLDKMEEYKELKEYKGDIEEKVSIVCKTFNVTNGNLGLLMAGTKGMGKSLTAKLICIKLGLPVICITEAFTSAEFIDFISNKLTQPCVIWIDEFEKIYYGREQDSLLTMLDGSFEGKKLFIFTANNVDDITDPFSNRTKRIRYWFHFEPLFYDEIREMMEELNRSEEDKAKASLILSMVDSVNYDVVSTFIEECNIFPEHSIFECYDRMNLEMGVPHYKFTWEATFINKNDGTSYSVICKSVTIFNLQSWFNKKKVTLIGSPNQYLDVIPVPTEVDDKDGYVMDNYQFHNYRFHPVKDDYKIVVEGRDLIFIPFNKDLPTLRASRVEYKSSSIVI